MCSISMQKNHYWVSLSKRGYIPARRRHLLLISASGPLYQNEKKLQLEIGESWASMSTEREYQTGFGLSNDQITSARWHHLPLIYAFDSTFQNEKPLITRMLRVLHEYSQNTRSKPGSAYLMVKLPPLGAPPVTDSGIGSVPAT
jgi:hypothetical protein